MNRPAKDSLHNPHAARKVANLSPHTRRVRHELVVWAVQTGRSVSFDALTVLLAAKEYSSGDVTQWVEDDVWHLWWVDILAWCEVRAITPPQDLSSTFEAVFAFLDAVDGFGPDSDSISELLGALKATGASPAKTRNRLPVH